MISVTIYGNGTLIGDLLVDFISCQFGLLLAVSFSKLLTRELGNCQHPRELIEKVRPNCLVISKSVNGITSSRWSLT